MPPPGGGPETGKVSTTGVFVATPVTDVGAGGITTVVEVAAAVEVAPAGSVLVA
jgi:hypothetical protein